MRSFGDRRLGIGHSFKPDELNELTQVSSPTLIITGTDYNKVPTANSLIIAEKIPGIWLVQIKDAGHAIMSQYSDKFNKILQTFLSTTTDQNSTARTPISGTEID